MADSWRLLLAAWRATDCVRMRVNRNPECLLRSSDCVSSSCDEIIIGRVNKPFSGLEGTHIEVEGVTHEVDEEGRVHRKQTTIKQSHPASRANNHQLRNWSASGSPKMAAIMTSAINAPDRCSTRLDHVVYAHIRFEWIRIVGRFWLLLFRCISRGHGRNSASTQRWFVLLSQHVIPIGSIWFI